MDDLKADPRYKEARRYAHNVRGFYTHLLVFVLVNAGLVAVNLMSSPGRIWFAWATFGWGIGLAAHGASAFAFRGWLGADWEERKIRAYLARHR
jgi:hypothetical protein